LVDEDDPVVTPDLIAVGEWEPGLTALFGERLRPGMSFVDAHARRMIRLSVRRRRPKELAMRQAFISIEMGFTTYSEGMTLAAQNAQPWDPGACRRR
jgi:hypothetical protein